MTEKAKKKHRGKRVLTVPAPDAVKGPESDECVCVPSNKETQAELLVTIAEKMGDFFHTPGDDTYASLKRETHNEVRSLQSNEFHRLLELTYYRETSKIPGRQAFKDAVRLLKAKASFDGPTDNVYTRFAQHENAIYNDLCDPCWNQVKIDANGWDVAPSAQSPVKFRRMKGMLPLPVPKPEGSLDWIRELLNIGSEDDWIMIISWLVSAMRPSGPYPILMIQGEQGSAKTTMARMLRSIVDPSTVPVRTLPRSERDLAISADASRMLAYDNLSKLTPKMSDAFCRISTGGGFGTRGLRTDRSEELFSSVRPIIMNGITEMSERSDLADRSLIVTLPPIPAENRMSEMELWQAWNDLRPYTLGVLCDALSMALKNYDTTVLPQMPRMADFAKWVVAAEDALPWEKGRFMEVYEANRAKLVESALEADLVATAVLRFMDSRGNTPFKGSPSQLMVEINPFAPEKNAWKSDWPKAPNVLSNRLMRAQTFLRTKGLEIERSKSGTRSITIKRGRG